MATMCSLYFSINGNAESKSCEDQLFKLVLITQSFKVNYMNDMNVTAQTSSNAPLGCAESS